MLPPPIPRIVTTSWDDGDPCDLRVAELLRARDLPGTFYFPFIGYDGRQTLTHDHLKSFVREGFEVGGHGMSHNVLPPLRSKEIAREVGNCKKRLEDILGEPIRMFSYSLGHYSGSVVRYLKEAGYLGGRTNRMLGRKLDFSPYEMPTTLQAPPLKIRRQLPKRSSVRRSHAAADLFRAGHVRRELGGTGEGAL